MPVIKSPHKYDKQAARYFDLLVSIYFDNQRTGDGIGETLGQFLVSSKEIYSQILLDWMEAKDAETQAR